MNARFFLKHILPEISTDCFNLLEKGKRTSMNKKSLLSTISILVLATFLLVPVNVRAAGLYYVSLAGSDSNPGTQAQPFRTIQYGVNKLAGGDTLYIRGGVYNELVTIRNSGTASSPIVISSYPGENAKIDGSSIDPGAYGSCRNILRVYGSYLVIRNFEATYPLGCGIQVYQGSSDVTFDNINLHDVFQAGFYSWGRNITIENSKVWRTNLSNACSAHNGCGYPYWSGGISWGDTTLTGTGIGTVVRNNRVYQNYGEGIMGMYTSNALIENNVVWDNWAVGIYAANSSNFIIRGNMIYYTSDHDFWRNGTASSPGIMLADENQIPGQPNGHDRQVYNNIIVNAANGIYYWAGIAPGAGLINDTIAYNTIVNNYAGYGMRIEGGVHQNTLIENNLIQVGSQAGALSLSSSNGLTFTHNLWSKTPSSLGSGDIVANALLADPLRSVDEGIDANWYKLTSSSPAIGKALAISITTDFFGNTRDGNPDIGASEAGAVATLPPPPTVTASATPTVTGTATA